MNIEKTYQITLLTDEVYEKPNSNRQLKEKLSHVVPFAINAILNPSNSELRQRER